MAAHAELGIVLGKIIKLIGDITAAAHDDQDKRRYEQLRLQRNRFLQPLYELCQFFSEPFQQLRDPPPNLSKIGSTMTKRFSFVTERTLISQVGWSCQHYIIAGLSRNLALPTVKLSGNLTFRTSLYDYLS